MFFIWQVDRHFAFQYQVELITRITLPNYHLLFFEKFVGRRSNYFDEGPVVQVSLFKKVDCLEKRKQPDHFFVLALCWWLTQHLDLLLDIWWQRHHLVGFLYESAHHERLGGSIWGES